MTFRQLREMEVVQLQQGVCLGRVDDLAFDADTAAIRQLILFGRPRLFGLLGRQEDLVIPWEQVEKVGVDALLVRCELPPTPPAAPSLWQRLRGKG